ncbi:MAG: hypothetical protein ACJ8DC_04450 [Gemmatimonadales bacterium]
MPILAIVVLLTATCGIIVVAGGIYLLAKGAITLAATSPADALTIEWQKKFRVNTQVPGIAFFVIGLCFVGAALYAASPPELIDLQGEVHGVDGPVTVIIRSEPLHPAVFGDGAIRYRFYPDFSVLTLEASAPGYEPMPVPVELSHGTLVNVGTIQLRKKIQEIAPKPESIQPISFQPPLVTDTTRSFGAPR